MHTDEAAFVSLAAIMRARPAFFEGQHVEEQRLEPRRSESVRPNHLVSPLNDNSRPQRSALDPVQLDRPESPTFDQPRSHEPAFDQPRSHAPAFDQPRSHEPAFDQPRSHAPAFDQPRSDEAVFDKPRSDEAVLDCSRRPNQPAFDHFPANGQTIDHSMDQRPAFDPLPSNGAALGLAGAESACGNCVFAASFPEHVGAVRDARLFRAAMSDAFDARLAELIQRLAVEVLGRELRLAAVDLESLARLMILERAADGPLRLRVALTDADVACDLPVVPDPHLQAGDAVLECRTGDIDARLGVRLAGVVAKVRP